MTFRNVTECKTEDRTELAVAALLVARTNQISISNLLPMFALYFIVYCAFIPSYVWPKKQKL